MNKDLFDISYNHVLPEPGKVLLSVPFIDDAYFNKAVILLLLHDSEGSVGYILNKPTHSYLHELIDDIPESSFIIHNGGPVSTDTLQFIHTLGNRIPHSLKISENLYWGGDFETVRALIKQNAIHASEIRFFIGYSGWDKNQLQQELTNNTWVIHSIDTHTVMHGHDEQLWIDLLTRMGEKYRIWTNFPAHPTLN